MMLNFQSLNPYLRAAMYSTLKPPFQIGQRVLFDYELIYLQKGSWTLTFQGKDFACSPGDILLLCPNEPHTLKSGQEVLQPHLHFDLIWDRDSEKIPISFRDFPQLSPEEQALIRPNLLAGQLQSRPFLQMPERPYFERLIFDVIDSYQQLPPDSIRLKARFLLLLDLIFQYNLKEAPLPEPGAKTLLPAVKNYLDQNCSTVITLDSLAAFFHYDKYYIAKQFHKMYGCSPMAYYRNRRAQRAKELLRSAHSVGEVSDLLGFSSIYAFSRFLKNRTGASPSQYFRPDNSI